MLEKMKFFYVALDMLKDTEGMFSRNAILGNNLSQKPVKIEFRDLGQINQEYATFDALGWKKGKKFIYLYKQPSQKCTCRRACGITCT